MSEDALDKHKGKDCLKREMFIQEVYVVFLLHSLIKYLFKTFFCLARYLLPFPPSLPSTFVLNTPRDKDDILEFNTRVLTTRC